MPKYDKVAFGNLRNACVKRGLVAHLRLFDGGQTIIIATANGSELFRWSSEWGDDLTPVGQAAEWLIDNGYIEAADLEG